MFTKRARLRLKAGAHHFSSFCIPVAREKSRWILTPRRASETRRGARRRWKTAHLAECSQEKSRLAIAVVQGEIKRSRAPLPPPERASVKGKDERAQGKKDQRGVRAFHTGMHGAHQFSVKPINPPRALPENEAFDGWRTRQRCSRHAALFRVMTKNRRDVHVVNQKSLSREEINAFVRDIDSNLRAPMTKWDR